MEYIKLAKAAEKWGISARRARILCAEGKIPGAIRKGKLYNTIHEHEKLYIQNLNEYNPDNRKMERKITHKEDNSLSALNEAVENEKKNLYHNYLNSTPNFNYNIKNDSRERKLFINKMTKKKKSQFKNPDEAFESKEYNSTSNTTGNINKSKNIFPSLHNKISSYFDESLNENSLIVKKLRNQNYFLKKQQIKTLDIIKKNPMIFQRPFSMLGDYYKSHKMID